MAEHTKHLEFLQEIPPWEWPKGSGEIFLEVLHDEQATESDQLIAAELAGEFSVINDELVDALIAILNRSDKSEELRGTAAIARGRPLRASSWKASRTKATVLLPNPRLTRSRSHCARSTWTPITCQGRCAAESSRPPCAHLRTGILMLSERRFPVMTRHGGSRPSSACATFLGSTSRFSRHSAARTRRILREAVIAAGEQVVDAAWPRVTALLNPSQTERSLLLAAIDAVASINPDLAPEVLNDLGGSEDDEIATAVFDALALQEALRER